MNGMTIASTWRRYALNVVLPCRFDERHGFGKNKPGRSGPPH
ncbi:MAG: hypothetical protein QM619_08950 [Micropruina sp.]